MGLAAATSLALTGTPLAVLPAHASTFTVTNCNTSGAGSLAAAIDSANGVGGADTIDFSLSSNCTVTTADTLTIRDSVTINNDSGFAFWLKNDAGQDGPLLTTASAGDLSVQMDLTVSGLGFDGNNIDTVFGLIDLRDTYYTFDVTINDSTFINAEYSGIRVDSQISLTVNDSYFGNNYGYYGGGVQVRESDVTVTGSTFLNNDSDAGGGLYVLSQSPVDGLAPTTTVLVQDSHFGSNSGGGKGGAIALKGTRSDYRNSATIEGTTFSYNQGHYGGAVYAGNFDLIVNGLSSSGDSDVPATTFYANTSSWYGGAIYHYEADLTVSGTLFAFNASAKGGGAISAWSDLPDHFDIAIYASRFDNNQAAEKGGAIYAGASNNITIHSSSFDANSAPTAGGLYITDGYQVTIANNTLYGNTASTRHSALKIATSGGANGRTLVMNNTVVDNASDGSSTFALLETTSGPFDVAGNIFFSTNYDSIWANSINDLGGNLLSGSTSGVFAALGGIENALPGQSGFTSFAALDLGALDLAPASEVGAVRTKVIVPNDTSIALDRFNVDGVSEDSISISLSDSLKALLGTDATGVTRFDAALAGAPGGSIDSGAVETFSEPAEPIPTDPNVVITDVSKSSIAATGDTFSIYGRGLDDVTELYIGGVKVSFVVVSATELRVTSGALPLGTQEILAIATDGRASFQLGVGVVEEPSYWTKNLGNGQAKIYAKNIVGEGKVQFFLNGKEIAWINAIDETDPKLRKANGAVYLVRTVDLKDGKNRLEVKVDGVRVRFTTYSR